MKFMGQCSVQFIIPSNLKIIVIMNNVLQHLKLKMKITTTKKKHLKMKTIFQWFWTTFLNDSEGKKKTITTVT